MPRSLVSGVTPEIVFAVSATVASCSCSDITFSTSLLIILPPGPEPVSWEKSIPFFSAKRRATGDIDTGPAPEEGLIFLTNSSGVIAF
ncbi:hypothetical protein ES708_27362 [subsurface metagenome]